ncbi:endonuclease/exonuclease/phosphatase family protein [Paenibacillus psychroresistens]|nr:endonuclease/exonuclease/phosphatase family protein [Paenibacillus psychroresistens]
MTFNIHHGKGLDGKTDLGRILKEILKSEADIVALQEVDRFQPRSYFRDQVTILAKGAGMFSCYSPSLNFGFSQYGNAILSKWPIASKTIFNMDGGLERRSILIANIKLSGAQSPNELESSFTIVNTHLGVLAQEYKWQMPILCEKINELSMPTIVLGDFNMEPSNATMKIIDPKWHRIRLPRPQATMQNGKQIDHIFTNKGCRDSRAWVQETVASDHHAVLAELPDFLK